MFWIKAELTALNRVWYLVVFYIFTLGTVSLSVTVVLLDIKVSLWEYIIIVYN